MTEQGRPGGPPLLWCCVRSYLTRTVLLYDE